MGISPFFFLRFPFHLFPFGYQLTYLHFPLSSHIGIGHYPSWLTTLYTPRYQISRSGPHKIFNYVLQGKSHDTSTVF